VAGGGLSSASSLALGGSVIAVGSGIALRRGRPLPRVRGSVAKRLTAGDAVALVVSFAAIALLAAFFRVTRVQPLTGWDAWAFWVPKAKVIYYLGGIGDPLFRN